MVCGLISLGSSAEDIPVIKQCFNDFSYFIIKGVHARCPRWKKPFQGGTKSYFSNILQKIKQHETSFQIKRMTECSFMVTRMTRPAFNFRCRLGLKVTATGT